MPIFHKEALLAATGPELRGLRPEHLANWQGLAEVLDRLTPEQRGNAIYADWLLPGRQTVSRTPID
ncbi:MAG: hypothetical protein ACK45B_09910 [Limisphaerales bacterium]